MTNKLTELKEAIQRAVPEIMELKFGCGYMCDGSKYTVDGSNYVLVENGARVKIVSICNHPKKTPCCGEYQNQDDEPIFLKVDKILGRDITLTDVLRALESTRGITTVVKILSTGRIIVNLPDSMVEKQWNLAETLDGQSDELVTFCHGLIVK